MLRNSKLCKPSIQNSHLKLIRIKEEHSKTLGNDFPFSATVALGKTAGIHRHLLHYSNKIKVTLNSHPQQMMPLPVTTLQHDVFGGNVGQLTEQTIANAAGINRAVLAPTVAQIRGRHARSLSHMNILWLCVCSLI